MVSLEDESHFPRESVGLLLMLISIFLTKI